MSTEARTSDAIAGVLAGMDTCVISDSLDALGLPGTVSGLHPLWEGARVSGRVVTMRLLPHADAPPPSKVHLGARAIEAGSPGDVIVVDNGGRTEMGSWGGLLSLAASTKGIAGVVSDGACRDVDEARQMNFPVFGRAAAARTARGRVYEASFGEPVAIGGVSVSPGDYIVADGSGVVVIGQGEIDRVIQTAQDLQAREARMAEMLRSGTPVASVLNGDYEAMLGGRQANE